MAVLNIRNLPDDVRAGLRVRAAQAGRSMEAEAREILTAACRTEIAKGSASLLQELVDELYGSHKPRSAIRSLLAQRRREAKRE